MLLVDRLYCASSDLLEEVEMLSYLLCLQCIASTILHLSIKDIFVICFFVPFFFHFVTITPLVLDLRCSCCHTDLTCPVSILSSLEVKLIFYAKFWGFFHLNQVIVFFHHVSKQTVHT